MRRAFGLVALSAALVLVGCNKGDSGGGGGDKPAAGGNSGGSSGGGAAAKPGVTVDHQASLAAAPEGAQAVITFDMSALWSNAIDSNFGLVPVKKDAAAVRKAMIEASNLTLGFDITAVKTVSGWVRVTPEGGEPAVAMRLQGEFGAIEGEVAETHEGVEVKMLPSGAPVALLDGALVMGTPDGIKLAIDLAKGKAKALSQADRDVHTKLANTVGKGSFMFTAAAGDLGKQLPPPFNGLTGAATGVSGNTFGISVLGDDAALSMIEKGYQMGVQMARAEVDRAASRLRKDRDPALILVVYLQEKWEDFTAIAAPTRDGDVLSAKVEMITGGPAIVGVIGVLAAVAVPAFIKYMRRAKTTEAIDQLDKLYKGSAVFYTSPRVDNTGAIVPCQFPKSVGPTPPIEGGKHPCCGSHDKDGNGRCDVDPDLWSGDVWSSLMFQMNDEHYYSYAYESNGKTGADATFTVKAYGDLDCDGVFSTFERTGYGDPDSGDGECSMKGNPGFFMDKETE